MRLDIPDNDIARNLASDILGEAVVAERITAGVMNWKFLVTASQGNTFILRFYPDERAQLVNFEPDLLRRCLDQGMSVPVVATDSRTGPQADWNYVLYRMLPGQALEERLPVIRPDKLSEIAQRVCAELEAMSQLHCSGYGDLLSADTASFQDWKTFISSAFHAGLHIAKTHGTLPVELADKLAMLERPLHRLTSPASATLTWADVAPSNIIVDEDDRFVGLIDFEGSLAAEMPLNIGYAQARFDGTTFFDALGYFWEADEEERLRADVYTIIRALRLLRYSHLPLPIGTKRIEVGVFLPGFAPALDRLLMQLT